MQVCQLQGNGVGVSTARAQSERAAAMEANEEGMFCTDYMQQSRFAVAFIVIHFIVVSAKNFNFKFPV